MVNIDVGVLASLISVVTLFITTIFQRLNEQIATNFLRGRLIAQSHAPFLAGTDFWFLNSLQSLFKFRKNPGILLIVILSIALVLTELCLELGVDVTYNCHPVTTKGYLIEDRNGSWNPPTDVELSSLSFHLQHVNFVEKNKDFTYVATGFPRNINSNLCIRCLPKLNETNTIASGCEIKFSDAINGAYVGIKRTNSSYGTHTIGMRIVGEYGRNISYYGHGDLTLNVRNEYSIMLFSNTEGSQRGSKSLYYWEYNNQLHASELLKTSKEIPGEKIWVYAKGPVYRHRISCDVNHVNKEQFQRVLLAYRSIQLEKITNPVPFNNRTGMFQNFTASDIYRSILALKAAEDVIQMPTEKEFKIFQQCATYKMVFAIPTLTVLLLILLVGIISKLLKANPCGPCQNSSTQSSNLALSFETLSQCASSFDSFCEGGSIIPTTKSATSSQDIFIDDRPSSDEYFRTCHRPKVGLAKLFKEADRIEVLRNHNDDITGLRVIPYHGPINAIRSASDNETK